jgi:hypothetical protein
MGGIAEEEGRSGVRVGETSVIERVKVCRGFVDFAA